MSEVVNQNEKEIKKKTIFSFHRENSLYIIDYKYFVYSSNAA